MTERTEDAYWNLERQLDDGDCLFEVMLYAMVAANKFNLEIGRGGCIICLTYIYNKVDVGKHSKEIAIHFFQKLLNNLYFKFDYEHFIKIKNEGKPIFMSNLK